MVSLSGREIKYRLLRRRDVEASPVMNIRFLELAQNELDDAVAWYDGQEEGLAASFLMSWIAPFVVSILFRCLQSK